MGRGSRNEFFTQVAEIRCDIYDALTNVLLSLIHEVKARNGEFLTEYDTEHLRPIIYSVVENGGFAEQ